MDRCPEHARYNYSCPICVRNRDMSEKAILERSIESWQRALENSADQKLCQTIQRIIYERKAALRLLT